MYNQKTIKSEVSLSGIGIHTGRRINLRFIPAERDTGIIFYRKDRGVFISAKLPFVVDTMFATTLGIDGVRIRTVEHLLAALYVFGITNILIEIDGAEVPVMDGSAFEFVKAIQKAGVAKQGKIHPLFKITKSFLHEEAHSKIFVKPHRGFKITYRIFYEHPLIMEQTFSIDINEVNFVREISKARTFGFLKDIEYLLKNGFAHGGSLSNAVILDEKGVLGGNLRFKDEFVRHKILDAIGDIALLSFPVHGHFIIERGGHTSHINFLRNLVKSGCYELIEDLSFSYNLYTQTVKV